MLSSDIYNTNNNNNNNNNNNTNNKFQKLKICIFLLQVHIYRLAPSECSQKNQKKSPNSSYYMRNLAGPLGSPPTPTLGCSKRIFLWY